MVGARVAHTPGARSDRPSQGDREYARYRAEHCSTNQQPQHETALDPAGVELSLPLTLQLLQQLADTPQPQWRRLVDELPTLLESVKWSVWNDWRTSRAPSDSPPSWPAPLSAVVRTSRTASRTISTPFKDPVARDHQPAWTWPIVLCHGAVA